MSGTETAAAAATGVDRRSAAIRAMPFAMKPTDEM
jgi:hypothetical protein